MRDMPTKETWGFNKFVNQRLGGKFSASYICSIKTGRVKNDEVLREIIKASEVWPQIQREREVGKNWKEWFGVTDKTQFFNFKKR